MTRRGSRGGFTLVEMVVALGLFALIGVAGFTLLDGVTRAQERSAGRLERLGDLQRGLYLIDLDLEAAEPGSLEVASGALAFVKRDDGARTRVLYAVEDGRLMRQVGPPGLRPPQRLLPAVRGMAVESWRPQEGWRAGIGDDPPVAVSLTLTLTPRDGDRGGVLRRVVALAVEP